MRERTKLVFVWEKHFSTMKKRKKTVVQEADVKWRQRQAKRVAYMEELGEAHHAANQPVD